MPSENLKLTAKNILNYLCNELPTRQVGSQGNQNATAFFAWKIAEQGFTVTTPEFDCVDWDEQGASLNIAGKSFEVLPSPYSLGCTAQASLVTAQTLPELELLDMKDKIVLIRGELAKEQLMPKNFKFYNPEEHQHLVALLEKGEPLAIVTATGKNPEMAGAVYPFPMIEDGDFNIPSVYMKDVDGERLAEFAGQQARLASHARRIPTTGCNVIAWKPGKVPQKVVICAHIDAKRGSPGALDNAAGITVLLLLAELLHKYQGKYSLEIVAINGEDYYANPGELQYLAMNADIMHDITLAVNLDGVGYKEGKTAYSLYDCPPEIANTAHSLFPQYDFIEGPQWYQSDHSIFIMSQVPAIALTSDAFTPLWNEVAHTSKDMPALVDPTVLVNIARCLAEFLQKI